MAFSVSFIAACQSTPSAEPTIQATTVTAVPQSETPTVTLTPEPTSLPGSLTIPLDSFGVDIPWLPLDESKLPTVVYIGINSKLAPFNDVQVRQAFAAATDRDAIAAIAERLYFDNVRPATNFTPSETIGRDLFGTVGIPFNPAKAKEYLAEAGYSDPPNFPPITLWASVRGAAPGFYSQVADALAAMWLEHLGVEVEITVYGDFGSYISRLTEEPGHMFLLGWGADVNDPDNFLRYHFHSGSEGNFSNFDSVQFDSLVTRAAEAPLPEERQILYIQAEQRLTEIEAGVIPSSTPFSTGEIEITESQCGLVLQGRKEHRKFGALFVLPD